MLRLETNARGAWRLIGQAEPDMTDEALNVLRALAILTDQRCRLSINDAAGQPKVMAYVSVDGMVSEGGQ